jgi:hypothetical protein
MPLVDTVANAHLDLLLGTSGVLPAIIYVGLMLSAPNSDGTGVVEVSGFGYSRVAVSNNPTAWPAAAARRKAHAADIVFPAAAGGAWGLVTHVGIFDAAAAGNLKHFEALNTPRQINDTDVFRFLAASTPLAFTE